MTQRITVLKSEVVKATGKNGKPYQVAELGYKTEEGKVKGMRIMPFGDQKAIFDVAAQAEKGDVLEAQFHQNEKGYWEFQSLEVTGEKSTTSEAVGTTGSSKPAAKGGNWETSEERAARQVLIVRQSSISSAVALVEATKLKASTEDVIKIAKEFEAYVLGQPAVQTGEVV